MFTRKGRVAKPEIPLRDISQVIPKCLSTLFVIRATTTPRLTKQGDYYISPNVTLCLTLVLEGFPRHSDIATRFHSITQGSILDFATSESYSHHLFQSSRPRPMLVYYQLKEKKVASEFY
jgi:hypothetical protein